VTKSFQAFLLLERFVTSVSLVIETPKSGLSRFVTLGVTKVVTL